MPRSPYRPALFAFLLGLLASCSGSEKAETRNVLVLSIDTLRSDALGCYGSDGGHTPNIDRLAEKGMLFRNAIAPMATTFPSHSSMFTGLYPRVHGVRWNGNSLGEEHLTLAEILDAKGYDTGAFVSYKAMVSRGGLDQGFDVVSDEVFDKTVDRIRSGEEVNRLAFEYLDGLEGDASSFLWLHYFEPHSPYPLTDYAQERMGDMEGPYADGATIEEFYALNKKTEQTEENLASIQALYDGRVRDADRLVGELIAGLEERGLLEDTILVVVGDHGQLLGEHGRVGHGAILWQDALDVPFLIVDPRSGTVGEVETRVGVVDLMPTVLEMLDLHGFEGMQGRSLAAAVAGEELTDEVYFAEVRIADPRQERPEGQKDAVAVFHEHFKFSLDGGQETLFDLHNDQGESTPLDLGEQAKLVQWMRPLAQFHTELSEEALTAGAALSPEMLAELAALGYVDGASE